MPHHHPTYQAGWGGCCSCPAIAALLECNLSGDAQQQATDIQVKEIEGNARFRHLILLYVHAPGLGPTQRTMRTWTSANPAMACPVRATVTLLPSCLPSSMFWMRVSTSRGKVQRQRLACMRAAACKKLPVLLFHPSSHLQTSLLIASDELDRDHQVRVGWSYAFWLGITWVSQFHNIICSTYLQAGMTEADVEAYLAGGRLEPNLHMFTNELYPPFRTRLEAARFASFQAFLAAYSDGWQNPQVCNSILTQLSFLCNCTENLWTLRCRQFNKRVDI